jgi:hypothetical protein
MRQLHGMEALPNALELKLGARFRGHDDVEAGDAVLAMRIALGSLLPLGGRLKAGHGVGGMGRRSYVVECPFSRA